VKLVYYFSILCQWCYACHWYKCSMLC